MTVNAAVAAYLRSRNQRGDFTPETLRTTRSTLRAFASTVGDHRDVSALTQRRVMAWWDGLQVSRSTARNRLSIVRTFLDWCVERRLIARNPLRSVKPPKEPRRVPRVLDTRGVTALYVAAPDVRARAIVALMVQCGLRCVEVHRLQMEDVDWRNRTVLVRGKGGHERVLPIPAEAWRTLQDYFAAYPASGTGPVIRRYDRPHEPLAAHTISTWVSRWMKEAGIKGHPRDGVSAHALRRTCATDMLDHGAHVRQVQAVLGHAHLQTTEVYLRRLEADDLRAAMEGRAYDGSAA